MWPQCGPGMPKIKLTDRKLKALKRARKGERYELLDTLVPGFGVRVTDKGQRTFILKTRYPGSHHPTRRALGEYGVLSLEKAREKAGEWVKLIRRGSDPAQVEELERQAKLRQRDKTFAAVAERFIAFAKANGERKAEELERDIRQHFLPLWEARSIESITAYDVAAVIEPITKRGKRAHAHNLFGHARRLFRWAIPLYLEHSPCAQLSPRRLIGERQKRARALTNDEIGALWRATRRGRAPYDHLYRTLLLTSLRLSEASEAQWSEIDIRTRTWVIPAERMKKTGREARPHLVPLTDDMVRLLESIRRFHGGTYVFSADGGKNPIRANAMSKPKARLDSRMLRTLKALTRKRGDDPKRVTLADWVNHDLRRTVRSNLSALRIEEEVREAVLAHARPGIKSTYDLHDYADEKREALELWGARLRTIVEPPSATKVVELAKVRA
jgi:integrase